MLYVYGSGICTVSRLTLPSSRTTESAWRRAGRIVDGRGMGVVTMMATSSPAMSLRSFASLRTLTTLSSVPVQIRSSQMLLRAFAQLSEGS